MARIEWVKHRLDNWALWKEREAGGGMGFPTQSSFLNDATTADRYRESNILLTVDAVDAEVTNQAVESLRPARVHLYATLQSVYIEGAGIAATARRLDVATSTLHARLDEADRVLRLWFEARTERLRRTVTHSRA